MDCSSAPSLPPKLRILPSGMSASILSAALWQASIFEMKRLQGHTNTIYMKCRSLEIRAFKKERACHKRRICPLAVRQSFEKA